MKANGMQVAGLIVLLFFSPVTTMSAPTEVLIKVLSVKIIKAMDLRVQQLQNKYLWMQHALKKAENDLANKKLYEIVLWTQRQRDLYKGYYEELHKVKSGIRTYRRIRDLVKMQRHLIKAYTKYRYFLKVDRAFGSKELRSIHKRYEGMLQESYRIWDQVFLVIESDKTQIIDQKRLQIIDRAADEMERIYGDLIWYNKQYALWSKQRNQSQKEIFQLGKLYGISGTEK